MRRGVRIIVEDEISNLPKGLNVIERMAPTTNAEERNAVERARLPKKPDIFLRALALGSGELRSGDITIQLTGIEMVDAEALCELASGDIWPCGNFAKSSLQRLMRARSLTCDGDYVDDTRFKGQCRIARIDLAQWLVEQGWARPTGDKFLKLHDAAKAAQKGIYRQ